MLGRRTHTMSFADVDGWESRIPSNSVYAQIRHEVVEHFREVLQNAHIDDIPRLPQVR